MLRRIELVAMSPSFPLECGLMNYGSRILDAGGLRCTMALPATKTAGASLRLLDASKAWRHADSIVPPDGRLDYASVGNTGRTAMDPGLGKRVYREYCWFAALLAAVLIAAACFGTGPRNQAATASTDPAAGHQ